MTKLFKNRVLVEYVTSVFNILGGTVLFAFYYVFFYKVTLKEEIKILLDSNMDLVKENSFFFLDSLIVGYISHHQLFSLLYTLVVGFFCFLARKSIFWSRNEVSKSFLIIIFFTSLIFTFNNGFSGFNFFTNNWYYFDRILLIISSILLLISPFAFFIYFPVLFLFFSSFNYPLDSFSFADKSLPLFVLFYTLSLYGCFLIVKLLNKKVRFEVMWIFGILMIVCCSYLAPFLIKLSISENYFDWFLKEDFSMAFQFYLDRGWLLNLSSSSINFIKDLLSNYQKIFLFIALLIEALGLFLFFRWRYSAFIIFIMTTLNVGIFFLSAIFFWKWITFNLLIISYLIYKKPSLDLSRTFIFATVLISIFYAYSIPFFPKLGWYSTPYKLVYYLDVEDENGEKFSIQGKDMAPFDIYFTFSRWDIFNKDQLNISHMDYKDIEYFKNKSVVSLKAELKNRGINKYDADNDKILELFLREYFTNFNQSEFKKELIISPPAHIQIRSINPFLFDKKVRKINIMAKELWYGNDSNKDFELHILKTIEL